MNIQKTEIQGVVILENFLNIDERGVFIKTFQKNEFEKFNLCSDFSESYFSISKRNVIRGMHFQLPPNEHEKLIYVTQGEITDVILDLRKSSKTFGRSISIELSASDSNSIYLPKGVAHGFKANIDNTTIVYNVSTIYDKESDFGIKYNSFGFNWKTETPILSERDKSFISFDEFKKINPF